MSVELLRRAAKVLREHAGCATAGPWVYAEGEMDEAISGSSDDGLVYSHYGDDSGVPLAQFDGRYIALMHPPVALALADWLGAQAAAIKDYADTFVEGKERPDDLTEADEAAVAVARAILREES